MKMRERRKDEATRKKHRQTPGISCKDLIMPIFVKEGLVGKKEIKSMPGIYQFSLKEAVVEARKIYELGIPAVILFGIPLRKDDTGSSAYDPKGIAQEAIRLIKKAVPKLRVIADVCMCEYTAHGHCGIIKNPSVPPFFKGGSGGIIDNNETIKVLAKIAVSYADAGVDVVAPSAMMDGQVKAIKNLLIKNNFPKVKILAYSAKYASSFYGPFRDAAESAPKFGDRKTYQMDYHNSNEAVLEAKLDIKEGADMLMVKPALGYQDIIYRIKRELNLSALPAGRQVACYSVSGEYSMVKAYCQKAEDRKQKAEKALVLEMLTGMKRAGADIIITYYAKEIAKWLKSK